MRLHLCGLAVGAAVLLAGCSSTGSSGTGSSDQVQPSPPAAELLFQEQDRVAAASPATEFGAGSYIVGEDIQLGRYSAGADTVPECRWRQSDDGTGLALDNDGADRPTQVLTLNTEGSRLVVAGEACHFTRLEG